MNPVGGFGSRLEPQSGICPYCGYNNGPTFGSYKCPSCGKRVRADPMARNVATWSRRKWLWVVLGGIAFGLALSLFSFEFGGEVSSDLPADSVLTE